MYYRSPISGSDLRPNREQNRLREAELRYYDALECEIRFKLLGAPRHRILEATNRRSVEEAAFLRVRSDATTVIAPNLPVNQTKHLAIPVANQEFTQGRLPRADGAQLRASCVHKPAARVTDAEEKLQHLRQINSVAQGANIFDRTKEATKVVRKPPTADNQPESCGTNKLCRPTGSPEESLARRKTVHWAPRIKVTGTEKPGILYNSQQAEVWTLPFFVQLTICGKLYCIHYPPTCCDTAVVMNFEKRLVKVVHPEHKETLRAFLKHEYTLTFAGRSRISRTNIPGDVAELRETAFKTFLNAVHKDAKVELS
jgi:hypothetical protein